MVEKFGNDDDDDKNKTLFMGDRDGSEEYWAE